ncbi:uncharacterized protein LOC128209289 isoform X2 [Mya arenaria]|uniref:uncharacterized protein LOC128209289 isoform X2 n=1 Tax=Mya arenaria TaxID=6604 RepID=UPI0022E3202E|nr:uncharacterized protein LOC128209289 isoform X2 [Mya arenaria]
MVCQRRLLTEKVKEKIDRLENEVEAREREVESERKLREAAEQQLETCYRDMYGSPTVNEELRERLPRANKSDPFKREELSETDLSSIEEQIVATDEEGAETRQSTPKMSQDRHSKTKLKLLSKYSPKSSRRSLNFKEEHGKSSSPHHKTDMQTGLHNPSPVPFSQSTMNPPLGGFYGNPYGANPYMPYSGGVLAGNMASLGTYPGAMYPGMSQFPPPPTINITRPMSAPAQPPGSTIPDRTGQPLVKAESASTLAADRPLIDTQDSQSSSTTCASQSPNTNTTATMSPSGAYYGGSSSLNTSPDSGIGASASMLGPRSYTLPNPQRPGIPSGTSMLPDPFMSPHFSPRNTFGATSGIGYEQNRHISSLLSEIDAQRMETRKLRSELADRETELETLRITLKAQELNNNPEPSELQRAAGVVEEVYGAQRRRDEAVLGRMRLANQERDEVIERLRTLEARMAANSDGGAGPSYLERPDDDLHLDMDNLDSTEELSQLLTYLDSPSSGEMEMSAVVGRVEAVRQRQRELVNEEMQVLIEQRDIALAKCHKLEEQLLRYQKDSDADGGMDKSTKTEEINIRFTPTPPASPTPGTIRPNLLQSNKKGTWQLPNPNNLTTKFRRYVFTTACTSPSQGRTPNTSRPTTPCSPSQRS